jgi:BirA family biotin operon repressor/biotin-[acetyl-CoA-carboxylase] ligase
VTLALPNFFRLIEHSRLDSTNEEALRLAAAGAPAGTLVWAREQTAGRGRRGRTWDSPLGNLYCSVVLRPGPSKETAQLSFAAAVALAEALADAGGLMARVKWPNDLMIGGRKIAGILLEKAAGGNAVVAGTGVNVSSCPEGATCLANIGSSAGVTDVLAAYAPALERWIAIWETEGFAPVRASWLARAAGVGSPIEVRLAAETLSGTFEALDDDGALVLSGGGLRRRITAGDVFLSSAAET